MVNRLNQKLEEITVNTLIVGVDIAKTLQWARFIDYRGMEIGKPMSFRNDKPGFESIVSKIESMRNKKVLKEPFEKVIIGMEPTGHYWKTLANYLMEKGYKVVCVNPYHTKRTKELDDNSPTASDKKEALVIAKLVKDGRYCEPYLPQDIYAELRVLTIGRASIISRNNSIKNSMTAILDEYFPEIFEVFKKPLEGKASRQILRNCPFPTHILKLDATAILCDIKKAATRGVGIKRVKKLIKAAEDSMGVKYGLESAKLRLEMLLEELELNERHLVGIESAMENMLHTTGYAEQMLSMKGIGIVTAASFLGEVGDPLRFEDARQIANYAGYNLVENSSGKNKSGTSISKRGRGQLRGLLYQMAVTMVGKNDEMKALHKYLTTRAKNPLKKKQSLVVIAKKIITVIYSLLKKQEPYNPALVLGKIRQEMMAAA